ncbi:hypothetical protein BWI96_07675 [Siphonobacter sp. SORGH_AS_0500]|nr:hypothetical protein BWI96_07675 [Siphonobacter sp. SORGH_AS_0500]
MEYFDNLLVLKTIYTQQHLYKLLSVRPVYRLFTLALFQLLGTQAAFSQDNKHSELFKRANLIVLETTDTPNTLKEATKYLIKKG